MAFSSAPALNGKHSLQAYLMLSWQCRMAYCRKDFLAFISWRATY